MNALLIDVGSTFIKYSVYSTDKGIISFNKKPFPTPLINDGIRFVVSRKELESCIIELFDETSSLGCEIAVFSVQMHGYVARLKDGSLSEYVSWRDVSGDANQAKFENVNFNTFGLSLKNNLPVTKIDDNTVDEFYTLGSYISYLLTGNNATHLTDAFASGFFLSPSGTPNQFAGKMIMPSVLHTTTSVGEYNGIKIICPFGDHQISYLGSNAGTNSYMINIGTGAQACCISSFDHPDGPYQKRPYFDSDSCLYSMCGLHGVSGNMRDHAGLVARIAEAIAVLPKKDSVIVGGGGGDEVFALIQAELAKQGLSCKNLDYNVGQEGLVVIVNEYCQNLDKK